MKLSLALVRLRRCLPLAVVIFTATLIAQPRYQIIDLGPTGQSVGLEPFDTIPIDAAGRVALWRTNPERTAVRAILYDRGTVTELGSLPGDTSSKAFAMNNAGQIVGSSGSPATAPSTAFTRRRAFVYANGTLQDMGAPTVSAYGINASGHIVGDSNNRPFLFSSGTLRELPMVGGSISGRAYGINDRGQVVGAINLPALPGSPPDRRAFVYENGEMRELGTLGGPVSVAHAINASGQVVGASSRGGTDLHAFIYENGVMRELPEIVGATESRAVAINASGEIVGHFRTPQIRAFVISGNVMHPLDDLVTLQPLRGPAGFSALMHGCGINDAGQITGIGSYHEAGSLTTALHGFLLTPVARSAPAAAVLTPGSTLVLQATPAVPVIAYQWLRNGFDLPGATQATFVLNGATGTDSGTYVCRVTTADGAFLTNDSSVLVQSVEPAATGRLINLSVLTSLANANDSMTVGAVLGGAGADGPKPVLVRAGGPSLDALNVTGTLADPRLEVFARETRAAQNDDWDATSVSNVAAQVGAFSFRSGSRDAAVYMPAMALGDNSVRIFGTGGGMVIAELYDATPGAAFGASTPRLINLSVLKPVGNGLTAGFVIGGTTSKTVLIRAIGPSLAPFNVGSPLADPQLALFAGQAKRAENDNWGGAAHLKDVFTRTGAFQLGDTTRDAALVVTLAPGNYTVQVGGVAGGTGTALVEVYDVP